MEEGGSKGAGAAGVPVPGPVGSAVGVEGGAAGVGSAALAEDESVQSMAAVKGRGASVCQVVAVLVNVALLVVSHVGVNAVVWSTVALSSAESGNATAGNATTLPPTALACNVDDRAVWLGEKSLGTSGNVCRSWDDKLGSLRKCPYSAVPALQSVRNDVLFLVGYAGLLSDWGLERSADEVLSIDWGLSRPCASCFLDAVECTTSACGSQCLKRLNVAGCPLSDAKEDAACQDCVKDKCVAKPGALLDCTGLPDGGVTVVNNCGSTSVVTVNTQDATCYTIDYIASNNATFNDVFQITFFNAITKAWEGGAYVLSVVIFVASFLWPYAKDMVMMIVWFRPMTHARRDACLNWLARLGRWSLVDVFAVIIIIIGLRIDKKLPTGALLSTRSSSAYSIYAFAVAALWALVQGEYMRHINRADMKNEASTSTQVMIFLDLV
jgi:hypothetical protein